MSELKATPGPWVARVSDGEWVVAHDRGDVLVASCGLAGVGYVTPEHDANLIAAAPELYEAARLFVEEYDAQEGDEGVAMMLAYNAALNAAKSALSKARGDLVNPSEVKS